MKKIILSAAEALIAVAAVFGQENIPDIMGKKTITQTAGRDALGAFAPEFAHVNDDILFGEVWNRQDQLSAHDRSIVTVISLMAQGLTDSSMMHHLQFAKSNGVTRREISEAITHASFYAGWPKAWAVFRMAKEVWHDDMQTMDEFAMTTPYPIGEPNAAYARYFIGNSYLAPMDAAAGGPVNVTFEPRCRNNWHIHHGATQVLVCVAGRGWYQEEGKEPVELKPGVAVAIPKEVKHWHGAAKDSWMQHLTYNANVENGAANEWLEPVDDEYYDKLK